jgi:hypothetical protein
MGVADRVPMVRCRLDGERAFAVRTLRYVPLAEFELWRYLMETRHHRQVTVEDVSEWVAEDAARWNSGYQAEELEPVLRVSFLRVGPNATPVPMVRFFPAETYPEAQEALLHHFEGVPCRLLDATPGYFVPATVRDREPAASVA